MKNHLKTVIITLILFFLSRTVALAENKCGVNIGPNYSQVDQVASMTNQGGWVVALGTPGNCNDFQSLFGKNLNVVIRAYNGGRTFTNEEALGWVATLGKLDTRGQVVYFMPWNEPNHDNEGGSSTAGNYVYEYSQTLKTALSEAGLLNTKVILLSPMVDKLNPSFGINGSFFNNHGGLAGFYNLFEGNSSINEYDQFNPGPCTADAPQNNCKYDQLGIPPSFYALEAGVVADGCSPPCYKDEQIKSMLDKSWGEKWKDDPNFKMFAIFSYDPHRSDWDIFSTTETRGFYQSTCTAGGVNVRGFDQTKFDQWFSNHQDQLVQCDETCGYAPSLSYCAATAFTPGEEGTGVPPARSGTDSRPFECDACNKTDKMIGSCATSFTVNDQVKYQKREYGTICEDNHWLEKPWGGTIGIDPSSTTIPFVGKKGQESEQKYLADYFEGTDKYYFFYQDPIQRLSHAGIWRKLAPKQTQDKLKREMVNRSCNTPPDQRAHNYQVISESGDTAFLSEIKDHQPPLETEADYDENYKAWENSDGGKWARLWTAVPMFSHEDTPGQIVPYVSTKIYDSVIYPLPSQEVEKVPHLARLYEASKAVMEILKPNTEEIAQSTGNSSVLLAAAEKYQPEEKTLLAQEGGCFHMTADSSASQQSDGSYRVDVTVYFISDGGDGDSYLYGPKFAFQRWNLAAQGTTLTWVSQWTGGPFTVSPGGSVSVSYRGYVDSHSPTCPGISQYLTCTFSVDEAGNFSTNCGGTPPQPPSCGLPDASPVDACNKEALRDTNPNDTLCCNLMKINLSAKDQVINTQYTPCITLRTCGCEYIDLGYEGNDPREWFCCLGCGENEHGEKVCVQQPSSGCDDWVPFDVNRQVGITLAHPYLSEIWDYTGKDKAGVFNIFRPETTDKFKELDAASSIQYSYSPGTVDPSTGSFYFPYLGGVQKAKEWVARTLLPSGE